MPRCEIKDCKETADHFHPTPETVVPVTCIECGWYHDPPITKESDDKT